MIGQNEVTMNLQNKYNMGYTGEFHLGSENPQKIRVMFDTGSANSWILSAEAVDKMTPARKN